MHRATRTNTDVITLEALTQKSTVRTAALQATPIKRRKMPMFITLSLRRSTGKVIRRDSTGFRMI
jgi:hypothetical protein